MPPLPDGPVGLPQYKTSYDPGAEYTSAITPTDTIKEIYLMVMQEQPLDVSSAADAWDALATHLGTITSTLEHDYHGVRAHWDSDAGLLFEDFVDNTTLSLSDWQQAASRNAAALRDLASAIFLAQASIGALWTEFDHRVALVDQNHAGNAGDIPYGIMVELTTKARSEVLEPLNKAYYEAYLASRPGGKFVGPTNGPGSAEYARALATLKAVPGVVPPRSPGTGPGVVSVPSAPAVRKPPFPQRPALPSLPKRAAPPPLPKRAAAPPPERRPLAVPLPPTTPVTVPNRPSARYVPPPLADPSRPTIAEPEPMAQPPTIDDVVLPARSGEPESPVEAIPGRPSAAELPQRLRGRGPVNEPADPPLVRRTPVPQLSGRGSAPHLPRPGTSRGDGPDSPLPRGGPALPGRNGKSRGPERNGPPAGPPDDDIPPNRLGSRRTLLGIRDTKPRPRPGAAEVEEPALQQSVRLTGRLGAQPELVDEFARQGSRPGLDGRAAEGPERRRQDVRTDPLPVDFVGDSDLFATRPAAPLVIDRPEEAAPVAAERNALRPALPKT